MTLTLVGDSRDLCTLETQRNPYAVGGNGWRHLVELVEGIFA